MFISWHPVFLCSKQRAMMPKICSGEITAAHHRSRLMRGMRITHNQLSNSTCRSVLHPCPLHGVMSRELRTFQVWLPGLTYLREVWDVKAPN